MEGSLSNNFLNKKHPSTICHCFFIMLVCTQWLSICLLYALSYKVKIETKNTSLRDVFFVFIIYIYLLIISYVCSKILITQIYILKSMSYKEQIDNYLRSLGKLAYIGNLIWNLFHIKS